MWQAAARGDVRLLRELAAKDPTQVNRTDKAGLTPLLHAAERGRVDAVKVLLAAGADANLADADLGYTPLREAVSKNHLEVVKVLIAAKVDLQKAPLDGFTPLHVAAATNNVEAVKLLLGAGADASPREKKNGHTPSDVAAAAGHKAIVELLRSPGKPTHTTSIAKANEGDPYVANRLRALGLDEHIPMFAKERIDASTFATLTNDELKELGLPMGHRKRLLNSHDKATPVGLQTNAQETVLVSSPAPVAARQASSQETQSTVPRPNATATTQEVLAHAKRSEVAYTALEVVRLLGKGAFGTVHLVCNKSTGGLYAAKSLQAPLDETASREFDRETTLLYSLRHPNLVAFVGVSHDTDGHLLLLTEFADGGALNEWLYRRQYSFTPEVSLQLCTQIASCIAYLHANNVLHRDLKSENVFLNADGTHAKVGDLGLAKRRAADVTSLHSAKGTGLYMAPEVLRGDPYRDTADVYSFALVAYEIYAGARPYPAAWSSDLVVMLEKVAKQGVRPDLSAVQAPPSLTALLQQCWAAVPRSRPPMSQVVGALQAIEKQNS